jgi:hypothetical protein
MSAFDPTHPDLLSTNDTDDRERASDGVSRYGAYLSQRADQFGSWGEPLDVVSYTVLAWEIASGPVMAPGYVEARADLGAVTCRRSEEQHGVLVADVEVPIGWPAGLRQKLPGGFQSWDRERSWSGAGDPDRWYYPRRDDKPALLITAHVWVPIPVSDLPAPQHHSAPGEVVVDDAKRAVRAVCRHVNAVAGPVVAAVRETGR